MRFEKVNCRLVKRPGSPEGVAASGLHLPGFFAAQLVSLPSLIQGAAYLRKYIVGVRSDESDGCNDQHEDDSQHYGILRNVLALLS